jgi:hypothetical protein
VDVVRTVDVAVPADAVPLGTDIDDYFLIAMVPVGGRSLRFAVEP